MSSPWRYGTYGYVDLDGGAVHGVGERPRVTGIEHLLDANRRCKNPKEPADAGAKFWRARRGASGGETTVLYHGVLNNKYYSARAN
jgi:hypothetical protein